MHALSIQHVNYTYQTQYQKVEALRDISADFDAGKVYAIVGKSGSGKTTLLSLMAGLDLPTQGEVLCHDVATSQMQLETYRREKVAVIYQNFRLFPLLTVAENVMYPMELRGMSPKEALEKAKALIERVGLPATVLDRYPTMLSGGEQQRDLDTANGENIFSILQSLAHEDGYCVIIVTHDRTLAQKADDVLELRDGQVMG